MNSPTPGLETIRVAANGIHFEVAVMGTGDRLALLLHGFPEHAYSWRYQMPLLAGLGYRCWAPNLRGYSGTDSPRQVSAYRQDVLVRDVASLIEVSGASETVLIGHDWGGALAWQLAMNDPQLVQRLVVLNLPHPACFLRELKTLKQLARSWYIFFFQLPLLPEWLLGWQDCRMLAESIRRTSRRPSQFPDEVLEVYRQNAARPGGLTAMLNWYRALFRSRAFRQRTHAFQKIDTPTLMLWGDADRFLDIATTRGTEEYVSNLTIRILHGVSHWIQQEQPKAVNKMLEAWLTEKPVPEYR